MARPRLDLLGALLLLVASLWFAPGPASTNLVFGTNASEADDLLTGRPAAPGHLVLAEGLNDEPDDESPDLTAAAAWQSSSDEASLRRGRTVPSASRRERPRATGPPA